MNKDVKIYHVETQEDHDNLMDKLDKEGYRWNVDENTALKSELWAINASETYIAAYENTKMLRYGAMERLETVHPNETIIKYKAKGVEQMEKVVVPKFVADWFELMEGHSLGVKLEELYLLGSRSGKWNHWMSGLETEDKSGYGVAEEIVAKMHLYGYEVEEKKYHWRKKKEYLCVFEEQGELYLNVNKETGKLSFESKTEIGIIQTSFTETEVKQLVSEKDFNKLEKVEIADDEC